MGKHKTHPEITLHTAGTALTSKPTHSTSTSPICICNPHLLCCLLALLPLTHHSMRHTLRAHLFTPAAW
jgi:hypothetical protein